MAIACAVLPSTAGRGWIRVARGKAMKLLNEYLEHALSFERMAAEENNLELRAQFENQAAAYRKLAADRAEKYGLPAPSPPQESK
jgi:hypothetical protein